MSHLFVRRVGLLSTVMLSTAALTVATTAAAATSTPIRTTLTAGCVGDFPGIVPLSMTVDSSNLDGVILGDRVGVPARTETTVSTLGTYLAGKGVATVTSTGVVDWTVAGASTQSAQETFTSEPAAVAGADLKLTALLAGPAIESVYEGEHTQSLSGIRFTLRGADSSGNPVALGTPTDGDGDPATAVVSCLIRPTVVARATVVPGPVPDKPVITRSEVTTTTATFFLAQTGGAPRTRYFATPGGVGPFGQAAGDAGSITVEGLRPGTAYAFRVTAYNQFGGSPESDPVAITTAAGGLRGVDLGATGTLRLKGPLVGTSKIKGTVVGSLDEGNAFAGSVNLGASTGTFTAFGFLPVRATVGFSAAPAKGGTVAAGFGFVTEPAVTIRGTSVLGVPLAAGQCHTSVPPSIGITGLSAGVLAGKGSAAFSLPKLTGCSTFGGLIGTSGYTATLDLDLAPKATAVS